VRKLAHREKSLPASLTLRVAILAEIESTAGKKSHRQAEVANGISKESQHGVMEYLLSVGGVLPMIDYA
jgi:hypothetical protein